MREITPLRRRDLNNKEIQIQNTEDVKAVLNLVDHMIAGKRFGEMDSAKQMYLLSCQEKIDNMQHGYYKESDVLFLEATINSFIEMLNKAKSEIDIIKKEIENESDDKYTDESGEMKKTLKDKNEK